jgi:hypothetical protein
MGSLDDTVTFEARYRAAVAIPQTLSSFMQKIGDWASVASQEKMAAVINGSQPYVPSPRYTLSLLRTYIREVEREGGSIEGDEFNALLFDTLQLVKGTTEADPMLLQYLSFRLGVGVGVEGILAVRVGPFHNDVGLRMWEAGYLLAGGRRGVWQ